MKILLLKINQKIIVHGLGLDPFFFQGGSRIRNRIKIKRTLSVQLLKITLIRGMLCSMQRAVTNFLYIGSSQFSDRTHSRACRLSRA